MRHIGAGILVFRIIGVILLIVAGLNTLHRIGTLGAVKASGVNTGGLFFIFYFMPVVMLILAAVVCFIVAGFLKKKQ